jgi:hypothetical protein
MKLTSNSIQCEDVLLISGTVTQPFKKERERERERERET